MAVYLAFDIETLGQHIGKNPMVAVAAVVMNELHVELDNIRLCLERDGLEAEERCMTEFWSNHKDKLAELERCAVPPGVAMASLVQWLKMVDGRFGNSLVVVSDNPAFDIAWINYYLSKYTTRPTLYYGWNESGQKYDYRRIWDTDSAMHGAVLARDGAVVNWGVENVAGVQNDKFTNSHDVLEDARNIAANYINLILKFRNVLGGK